MPFDNTNTGAIFKNNRKEKDSHPDRTGSINVEGVDYFIDGWLKTSKKGEQFLSLSVKRKNKQAGAEGPAREQNRPPGRPQPEQRQRPASPAARPQAPTSRTAPPSGPTDPEPEYGDDAPDADPNF